MTKARKDYWRTRLEQRKLKEDHRIRAMEVLLIEARAVNEVWVKAHTELNDSVEHTLSGNVASRHAMERDLEEANEALALAEETIEKYRSAFGELPDSEGG